VVAGLSNAPFFVQLLGDSSYIIGYLRAIGYDATTVGQTGSNFGADLSHETPFLVSVGQATMVSDGVTLRSAEFSNTAFRTVPVTIGARAFLGNAITVPPGAALGDNCFVGSKTMIPSEGPTRADVGLLGSPPFEIPRTRHADPQFNLTRTELRRRLARKNRHNLTTMALFLGSQWARAYVGLVIAVLAINLVPVDGNLAAGAVVLSVVELALGVLLERAATSFRPLRPRYCSIYEPYFWWHERTWKFGTQPAALNGTPMKPLVLRLLGVRVGRRVFDDGAGISEKSLVQIGDEATINAGTALQSHSMEDGVFKSDMIVIGPGCTLGTGAFVHYGTTLGAGAHLGSDAFLMKGQTVPAGSHWRGNPAQEVAPATVGAVAGPVSRSA
jgi:non-ribosomal peptide synthetase-like protein